ncbi:MAG: hypothetical protein JXO48_01535 [Deltaproteobacteria bacterium]|nr:hypothetical protein [Deltaproteobacteria bacterium]
MKRFRPFVVCSVCLLFISCAASSQYHIQANQYIQQGDYSQALEVIEQSRDDFGERDRVIYCLEKGIIEHYAGRYDESNRYLAQAEELMEKLYTQSVSQHAASFLINDNVISYQGEDFENAMTNVFMALNYSFLGRFEDALVEARKVDSKLHVINSRYGEKEKNVYRDDAFIRFIMGVLYEAGGEVNDAYISFKKAAAIYQTDYRYNYGLSVPPVVVSNLLSAAEGLHLQEEAKTIRSNYGEALSGQTGSKAGDADVYVLHYNGRGPEKTERRWMIPMPDGYIMPIAYPAFEMQFYSIRDSNVSLRDINGGRTYECATWRAEDIEKIAIENLENRLGRIKAKAIARATAKYLLVKEASKAAKKESGTRGEQLVKTIGNIGVLVTERADIRHWKLLPAEIRIGHVQVPPGTYEGIVTFVDSRGNVVFEHHIERFTVKPSETRFLPCRTVQ